MPNFTDNQRDRWYKPIAWLLAIVGVGIFSIQCAIPVTSTDLWWHMTIGRHMLNTGQITIDHSIFTWTNATPYHIYNAWISEVILYLIYAISGPIGIITFGYIIHASFFGIATSYALQRGISTHPMTWLIIIVGIVLSFTATVVQPTQFSFAFMFFLVWLYFFIRFNGVLVWWLCYLLPIIIILWINSHGEFALGSLFFLSVGLGELLNAKFSPETAMPRELRKHLFSAFALCIPALLINPFGYKLPLSLYTIIINTEELAMFTRTVAGWDPTYRYNAPPYYAIDYLIIAMFIYAVLTWQTIKNKRIDWVAILAFIIYSFVFIKFVRTTRFLAPVFVFTSLDLLANKTNSWIWPQKAISKMPIYIFCVVSIAIVGWRTLDGAICYRSSGSLWTGSMVRADLPVEEVDYLSRTTTAHKIGNIYQDGGYLTYRLWPNASAMIDTRYFPFKSWFNNYLGFHRGDNIQDFINRHKVDVWLIPHSSSAHIAWFLNSKQWTPLFIGPVGIVFGATTIKNSQPQISPNIGRTDCFTALKEVFHTVILLKNWDLATQMQTHTLALTTSRPSCQTYQVLNNELSNTITGVKAFFSGDYTTAAIQLSKNGNFLDTSSTAVAAFTILGQRAWNAEDYTQARNMAIAALKLMPKNAISVYNAAITDWQYNKAPKVLPVTDDITWQFLVDILLSHQEKIPPTVRAYIVSVFTAMQNGTLHEKPAFIAQ